MKKILLILAFGVIFTLSGFAQAIKIGVAIPSADHGWTGGVVWWANNKVAELKKQMPGKFDFTVVTADSASSQVKQVEDLVVKGIKYLVILPHESAPLTPIVKEAAAKGIICIVVDRGLTDTKFGYVNLAGDNTGLGRESGKWMAAEMKKLGIKNYVAMGGMPVVIDKERMDAFFSEMNKDPNLVNLLGKNKYEFSDWSTQKGLSIMETYLQKYKQIDAVFCQDDDVLRGVLQAIKESGRKDVKIVLGGAGSKIVYKMILDGHPQVKATATYHPSMIADGMQYAIDIAVGKNNDDFVKAKTPINVVIPSVMVTKANVKQYYNPKSSF